MSVQAPTQTRPVTPQLRSFLTALEAAGSSERLRDAHRSAVERLAEFMSPRGAEEATPSDLRSFLSYLGELGVSHASQAVYRAVLVKWMEHLAMLAPTAAGSDAGEATGVLDYSKDPDPVDDEQTWPLRRRSPGAWAEGAEAPILIATLPVEAVSSDFGSAFDAAAAATRQAESVARSSWADDGSAAQPEAPTWGSAPVAVSDAAQVMEAEQVMEAAPVMKAEPVAFEAAAIEAAPVSFEAPAIEAAPAALAFEAPATPPDSLDFGLGPSAGAAALSMAPAATFGFGAEEAGLGDSTMMLSSGPTLSFGVEQAPTSAAQAAGVPAEPTPPAPELPAFLRAPSMPVARSTDNDAFDPGFTPSMAPSPSDSKPARGIALSTAPAELSFGAVSADEVQPPSARPAREPRMGEDTLEGWCLRTGHSEKKDLSLAEIRNMALAGTINARTMVKRPGGEWMPAGQFAPLRAVFASVADGQRGAGARDSSEPDTRPLPPALAMLFAWSGALGGAMVAGLGWWLGALVAGQEVVPLATLGGLFGGFAATWLSRTEGKAAGIPGAVAGALSALFGRYLVFLTLQSGVVTFGTTEAPPTALAFIQSGLTPAFAVSVLASVLLGLLLGCVGAGRPR